MSTVRKFRIHVSNVEEATDTLYQPPFLNLRREALMSYAILRLSESSKRPHQAALSMIAANRFGKIKISSLRLEGNLTLCSTAIFDVADMSTCLASTV